MKIFTGQKSSRPRIRTDRFSLFEYKRILAKAKSSGYAFFLIPDFKKRRARGGRHIFLRHDVDVSPLNALKMAEVERSLGARAVYYIRLHSVFYNPCAQPFFGAIKRIKSLGHEIGLHYDCAFYGENGLGVAEGITKDAGILEKTFRTRIRTVSQHRPAVNGKKHRVPNRYVDAYDSSLLGKVRYISDSGFKWRGRTLSEIIGEYPAICALIHPDTWAHADLAMPASYKKTARSIQGVIEEEISGFIDSTKEYLMKRFRKEID